MSDSTAVHQETQAPTARKILLEIAIASVEDGIAAESGGADRVELCAALDLGGLTPSLGTFLELRDRISLPIIVLIRPRAGGFTYRDADVRVMRRDVQLFLDAGAAGIAVGLLNADRTVDVTRCAELLREVHRTDVVFHRAFDLTSDANRALEQLIDLGFRRVLTSGQQSSAALGADKIAGLVRQARGRIQILPAAGIAPENVQSLLRQTNCGQVHASLRRPASMALEQERPGLAIGVPGPWDAGERGVCIERIKQMVFALRD